ncbi:MAG: MiaB/RimO family radical SAM methylthiotransferase [Candidatus Moraniibacteriota bacterium]|jgi:tRNA-2-methylthio-N6-dimethylallyladenosine synthase
MKNFFVKTFGCQQNVADSERLVGYYKSRGFNQVDSEDETDLIVINTCMIRDKAEERVYGYIRNLQKKAEKDGKEQKIILTGCIVGAAAREPSGKMKKKLEKRIPDVELMPIEEVGFEYIPERVDKKHAWVVISNGCNNHCAFCIVPFARGKEISRPYADVMQEVNQLVKDGFNSITLLGQNVNSYGSDLVLAKKDSEQNFYELPGGETVEPIMVNHLGRTRIPTLFPYLLDEVSKVKGVKTVTFTSSNPWDFSDELIDVIAENKNIDRLLHLPVQSGSDKIIKKMNRWYTSDSFLKLIDKIKNKVEGVDFVTDIIVGFPGETEEDFQASIELLKKVGFVRAFIGCYSERPGTVASKEMPDTIEWSEKKRRWHILNELINKPNLGISESKDWIRTREKHSVR